MKRILVINAKGGCGKSTLTTNLASYYANQGLKAAIIDYDPQGCSSFWLDLRAQHDLPHIEKIKAFSAKGVKVTRTFLLRSQQQTDIAIIDAPAGIKGFEFDEMLNLADLVLVPVLPTPIDVFSTNNFITNHLQPKLRIYKKPTGIVINRLKSMNSNNLAIIEQVFQSPFPVVSMLHDTQAYMNASFSGRGIFDEQNDVSIREQAHWHSLIRWLQNPVDTNALPHLSVINGMRIEEDKENYY